MHVCLSGLNWGFLWAADHINDRWDDIPRDRRSVAELAVDAVAWQVNDQRDANSAFVKPSLP